MERECDNCKHRDVYYKAPPCNECNGFQNWESDDAMTNADRIRSFSDEEMAEFLDGATNCYCFPCTRDINNLEHYEKCKHESGNCEKEWLEWLKGEADEDQT